MDSETIIQRLRQLHKNLADNRIILIDGIINDAIGKQIEEVIDILKKTGNHIDIYINSPGGSAGAFLNIAKKMKTSGMTFDTMCLEQAGSGAFLILAAGTKRTALKRSRIVLFNNLWIKDQAKAQGEQGLTEAGQTILQMKSDIEKTFKELTKNDKNPLLKDLFTGKILIPEDALKCGLIDFIV